MRLADHDLLVVDQVTSFLSNDFAIRDAQGAPVGGITTEGGVMSRMFLGNRELAVHEGDGSVVLRVVDTPDLGRDRFDLVDGAGRPLAQVVKEVTFFSKRLSIAMATGDRLDLQGQIFDYDFAVTGPVGVAATVSRQWPGIGGALLGLNRYVLAFTPGTPDVVRTPVLGAVVALDLVRAKEERRRR